MRRNVALLFLGLALLAPASCVTKKQVEEIVANSNAAMVDVPDLAQADGDVDEKQLTKALGQIESLINANPTQTVLVNTLRVRQTMLLTVHGKYEAAKIALAKATVRPPGTRDGALWAAGSDIIWWFERAKDFPDKAVKEAWETRLPRFDEHCKVPEGSEIRYYLETMRAMIALSAANTSNPLSPPIEGITLEDRMVSALEGLVARFDRDETTADEDWVKANWEKSAAAEEMPLALLRARVWLREAMKGYFRVAQKHDQALKKLSRGAFNPAWKPKWVAKQAAAWATANPPPNNPQ